MYIHELTDGPNCYWTAERLAEPPWPPYVTAKESSSVIWKHSASTSGRRPYFRR